MEVSDDEDRDHEQGPKPPAEGAETLERQPPAKQPLAPAELEEAVRESGVHRRADSLRLSGDDDEEY